MNKISTFSIGIAAASILSFVNLPIVQAQIPDSQKALQEQPETQVLVS